MRGQRQSGMAVLVAFASQILMGGISRRILFTGTGPAISGCTPKLTFLPRPLSEVTYASLDALSMLAEKRKEVLIEALCR